MHINWLQKKQKIKKNESDVSISVSEYGTYITFRNGCLDDMVKTDYIVVGVQGKRLYFAESNEEKGFKLSKKSGNKRIRFKEKLSRCFVGDYKMMWSDNEAYLYIDSSKVV